MRYVFVFILTSACMARYDPQNKILTKTANITEYSVGDIDAKGQFEARLQMTFWGESTVEVAMPDVHANPTMYENRLVMPWNGRGSMEFVPDGDSLRWKMIFATRPLSNTYKMQLSGQWQDYDYFYQPPVTDPDREYEVDGELWIEWTDASGVTCSRAKKVNGSYAVYHKTKRHNARGKKNYGCGKVCHIYCPKATDAIGAIAWCNLHIDGTTGEYTVTIPADYLNKAVYPVIVNDQFGYTTIGTTSTQAIVADTLYLFEMGDMPEDGTLDSIVFYDSDASQAPNCHVGLYQYDGSSDYDVVYDSGDTSYTSGAGWYTETTVGNEALTSGREIRSAFFSQYTSDLSIAWDTVSGYTQYDKSLSWPADLPDPAGAGFSTTADRRMSVYINYTPSGGGPTGSQVIIIIQ